MSGEGRQFEELLLEQLLAARDALAVPKPFALEFGNGENYPPRAEVISEGVHDLIV